MREKLEFLIGEWEAEAVTSEGVVVARERVVNEWLEGGLFLVQRADGELTEAAPQGWRDNWPLPSTVIIGLDDETGEFTYLYADARGVSRSYRMTVSGREMRVWRDTPGFNQRYVGLVGKGTITGAWEFSEDGVNWRKDFDLDYRRVS